ncbi:thymidine phosphorylase [candidate division WOR-3 bacterium]|nr:thymidine phosphorylase [candidate division WOR-3 bacterium]
MDYSPIALICKKRDGKKLTSEEIQFLVSEYTENKIPDYQFAAFLMVVYFRGMDFEETTNLMQAMMHSGELLTLPDIKVPKIDKHSTGGVGDKVSLVLAPLLAACGVCVPMISGRGLGHTGGTLDKLESIPGFRTDLTIEQFKRQLKEIGVAMIGQTAEIAPADKKMYALRDVTATVDSIPLICASIMSKKLAEDLDGLVLDVKFGSGAFMRDYMKAKLLARTMVQIGKRSKVKTVAVLTDMDSPLGICVGNSLEVMESVESLKGNGPDDLMEVTFALAEQMLKLGGMKGGRDMLAQKIASGEALAKFRQVVEYQGGDVRVIEDYKYLPLAKKKYGVPALRNGYIHAIDNYAIGMLLAGIGGGRLKKEDGIDPGCGFKIYKKVGDRVARGEPLAEVFVDRAHRIDTLRDTLRGAFSIESRPRRRKKMVREIID